MIIQAAGEPIFTLGPGVKIFGEYYRDISAKKSDMFVLGLDLRHYQQNTRDLIWANRYCGQLHHSVQQNYSIIWVELITG